MLKLPDVIRCEIYKREVKLQIGHLPSYWCEHNGCDYVAYVAPVVYPYISVDKKRDSADIRRCC